MSSSIWRSLSRLGGTRNATRRHWFRFASSAPSSSGSHHPYDVDELPGAPSAKVLRIVDDIAGLTLAEVADMSMLLKKRLRIPNVPVMPMGMNVVPDMWYETSIAAHRMFPPGHGHDLDHQAFVEQQKQQQQQQQRRKAASPAPPPPPPTQQKQPAGGKTTAAKKSPAKAKPKVVVAAATVTETETEMAIATTTTTTSEEDEVIEDDEEGVTVEEVVTEEEAAAAEIDGEDLDEDVKPNKKPKNRPELRFCKRNGALPALKDTVRKKKPFKSEPSGPSICWDPPEPVLAAVGSTTTPIAAVAAGSSTTVEPPAAAAEAAPSAASSKKKAAAAASSTKSKKSSKK